MPRVFIPIWVRQPSNLRQYGIRHSCVSQDLLPSYVRVDEDTQCVDVGCVLDALGSLGGCTRSRKRLDVDPSPPVPPISSDLGNTPLVKRGLHSLPGIYDMVRTYVTHAYRDGSVMSTRLTLLFFIMPAALFRED